MRFTQTAALAAFIACASAADAAPTCTIGKVEAFTDDKCTKVPTDKEVLKTVATLTKTMKEAKFAPKCEADGSEFKKATCTAAGMGLKYYKDDKCATELSATTTPKVTDAQTKAFTAWGTCIKSGTLFIKVSDAAYIKAAAVAVVAVAASLY